MGGAGQLVTHPLFSLPPTPLPSYYTGSLPGCKSWWHNYTQETSKNGLKQETARKPAISLHTKEIKGHWGAKSRYIPSDLSYFLYTFLHFQPSALSHHCIHFSSVLLKFCGKCTLLKNCCLHLGLLMWIQQRKEARKSLTPTTHMHTQKEIQKIELRQENNKHETKITPGF